MFTFLSAFKTHFRIRCIFRSSLLVFVSVLDVVFMFMVCFRVHSMFTVRPLGFPVFTVCVSMFTMCCSPWNLVFPSSSNVHCKFQCSLWNQCSLRVSVILVFIVFNFNPDIINREHSQGCSNRLFTVLS